MRKALLVGAAGWLAFSATARAQQASLFTGSFNASQIQYTTVIDKAPLVAPIPNQPANPGFVARVYNRLLKIMQPTLGSNPVASVKTTPTLSSPVSQATFQPSAPFFNPQ